MSRAGRPPSRPWQGGGRMANPGYGGPAFGTPLATARSYDAGVRTALTVTVLLSALLLAACGGGGSASASAPGGSNGHTPAPATPPPASGQPQTVHRVIGFSQHTMTESVPGSDAPALPPGFSDAGPLAHAVIVYPDGSTQVADGNGVYDPAKSSYAFKYQAQLGRNASVQPIVVLTDPTGAAAPSTAAVSAYGAAEVAASRFVQARHSFARRMQIGGNSENVAGVQLLPQMGALIAGSLLSLNAVGVDTNDNVLDISQAHVSWSAQ